MRSGRLRRLPLLLAALLVAGGALLGHLPFRLAEVSGVTAGQAAELLRLVRRRTADPAAPISLPEGLDAEPAAFILSLWKGGHRVGLWQVEAPPDRAVAELAARAARAPALRDPAARIKLEAVTRAGWVPEDGLLFGLSFVEGRTGVSGRAGDATVYVSPSDLAMSGGFGTFTPLPQIESRLNFGLDAAVARDQLARAAAEIGLAGAGPVREIGRIETVAAIEGRDLAPRAVVKTLAEKPPCTRDEVIRSVRAGAQFLLANLEPGGRFRYTTDPFRGTEVVLPYSWTRHQGAAYSLALVGRLLGDEAALAGADRAIARGVRELRRALPGTACLRDKGACYVGTSALALLAIAERRAAAGDPRFDAAGVDLAAFLRAMQRPDGFFFHRWRRGSGIDEETMKPYASQQAVLALARWGAVADDDAARAAAKRGMDYLAGPYWDFLLGRYLFGTEHWSCLAAEEVAKFAPEPAHAAFCRDIASFYANLTYLEGETPHPDEVGGLTFTQILPPFVGGTATAAEATVSALALGGPRDRTTAKLEAQLRAITGFLVRGQIGEDDLVHMPDPERARGGFLDTTGRPLVSIDTVQHAISALVRALPYL